ncbi:MAG: cytochrome c biogenesis protein CcsA [Bacteroidia bacterium]|nr:cytochrome c biogenesis protein CcsA [Bacteroidia bacterium]
MQTVGAVLVILLWVSGIWGAVAAWESYRGQRLWRGAAWGSWLLHTLSLVGTIGLLLFLLLAHRYEFYYVWAHSSRQLPVEYITAALWEGQEGSFLLWMGWHLVLGWLLLALRDEKRWALIAGLLAVNGYLATFLLGIHFPIWGIAAMGALLWMGWGASSLPLAGRMGGGVLLFLLIGLKVFWIKLLGIAAVLALGAAQRLSFRAAITAGGLLLLPVESNWGSFPFLYLWEAKRDIPQGFVPSDGNGINPLLQSFWMVIHPPVLFSGYAAAALPFWEGLLAVRAGGVNAEVSRRLLRWLWITITLLGLGIGLGAYWAYETLNFGGYWNWDPVENASLAPWLVMVAAAHLIWVWRRQRRASTLSIVATVLGFPLVLYSSYLTRSGVLAESSVHSFTDLGLGEWLLWGVWLSLGGPILLLLQRKAFPLPSFSQWGRSALTLGALLLIWAALFLLLLTSLPVLNKILGTSWTLGSHSLQVYYEWMGLIGVPLLGLMGYALFQTFRIRGWETILWFSSFLLIAIVAGLWWAEWDFVYHSEYRRHLIEGSLLERVRGAFFLVLDDFLLGAALVAIGGAIALLLQKRHASPWAILAHMGFALLVIGSLFSSGYQRILSQNLSLHDLSGGDNLFLPHGGSAAALGYFVRYEGLLEPVPPIQRLSPILHEGGQTLWRFQDSLGFSYQVWLPDGLLGQSSLIRSVSLSSAHSFIEANLALLPVEPADRRYRYKVTLTRLDSSWSRSLLLEADVSESSGLLAHPAHVRLWHGDLYVHLTSLPKSEGAPLTQGLLSLGIGDTAYWGEIGLVLERLTEVENASYPTFRTWIAAWKGNPHLAYRFPVEFSIHERQLMTPSASVSGLGLTLKIESISVKTGKFNFQIALRRRPDAFITVKILYKPFISLFWGGILLLLVGTAGAAFRHRNQKKI